MIAEVDLEAAQERFEKAKDDKAEAKANYEAELGKYHMTLIARRDAGETLTAADMKALVKAAIHTEKHIQEAWIKYLRVQTEHRLAKLAWDKAYRAYWDGKDRR
jgi:hypothetical protein